MGRKSIIFCLPTTDARVGLPFASAQAMSAAATLRGVEVLRREVRIASLSDESESMKNIKVVVVDVGAINVNQTSTETPDGSLAALDSWSPSEKVAYGAAFASLARGGSARKPTDVSVFVKTIVNVVRDGRKGPAGVYSIGLRLSRLREWIRGDRVVVGAGARTYGFAAGLPPLVLDALLNFPYLLISIRNALLPIPPRVAHPYPPPVIPPARATDIHEESDPEEHHENTDVSSDVGSEADVESNEGSGVGESWISLKEHETESPERT